MRSSLDEDASNAVDFMIDYFSNEFMIKTEEFVRTYILNKGFVRGEMK